MIDIVLNVLLGLGLIGAAGLVLFCVAWWITRRRDRKALEAAEKAQALKAGGGGGPDPTR
jgi:hypothetical protein